MLSMSKSLFFRLCGKLKKNTQVYSANIYRAVTISGLWADTGGRHAPCRSSGHPQCRRGSFLGCHLCYQRTPFTGGSSLYQYLWPCIRSLWTQHLKTTNLSCLTQVLRVRNLGVAQLDKICSPPPENKDNSVGSGIFNYPIVPTLSNCKN